MRNAIFDLPSEIKYIKEMDVLELVHESFYSDMMPITDELIADHDSEYRVLDA